ncbi:MAG: bifunctional oligoribonuclease/PAP phosphatase NrnA [Roseibacillus sp.]|jgi:phosphoesterase RecJ-like protein
MGQSISPPDLAKVISDHERFVLLSHTRPDGDAIGSEVALKSVLEAMGKSVRALNEDGAPEHLEFLEGAQDVERPGDPVDAEVVIALDTANRERLGAKCLEVVRGVGLWVNIDHHISNEEYGDLVLIDTKAAATGEILYGIIRTLDLPLPDAARDALYTAVSTDTGSFQYSNTTARTHEMAADLIGRGLEVATLTARLYHNFPFRRVELLTALLGTLERSEDGRIAWWSLPLEVKERLGTEAGDSEGLIDVMRAIRGVVVCAFLEEMPDGKVRLSMRSKSTEVNVCDICAEFGGGGHALAAGARMSGPLPKAVARMLTVTKASLHQ